MIRIPKHQRSSDASAPSESHLPLRGDPVPSPRTHARLIIAHHLVLTGYAHWLSNDLRGSGSTETRSENLKVLGPVHTGRKRIQPPKQDVRQFYRKAEPLLAHETLWFDPAKRQALDDAFREVVSRFGYTVWACALCSNHAHLVVRRHRDDAEVSWGTFASLSRDLLRERGVIPEEHPLWSDRPYKVFLYTPDDVRGRIDYVEQNPVKEGLPPQHFDFVLPYDGWPFASRGAQGR